jgi:hypothetical protein
MNSLRDSFKNQVILCTSLMILAPIVTFNYMNSYLAEKWIPTGQSSMTEKQLSNL